MSFDITSENKVQDIFPKITIVTPSYNQAAYLEDTILSVLDQKYPNLEYIIIDGGSTDGSVEIIKRYESKLAYWVSEKDSGMYEAIQKGFDKSTGDILAWINSDDMYHPDALFLVAEVFNTFKNIEWLTGAATTYNEKGQTVEVSKSRILTRFQFWSGDYKWIQQESTFFKRSLWDKAGSYINAKLDYAGDFELWLRFFKHAKLYNCSALLGGFRQRGADQKSIEGLKSYYTEVKKLLKDNKLPFGTSVRIALIRFFNIAFKIIQKRSFLNELYLRLIDAPEKIEFDRFTQRYRFKK